MLAAVRRAARRTAVGNRSDLRRGIEHNVASSGAAGRSQRYGGASVRTGANAHSACLNRYPFGPLHGLRQPLRTRAQRGDGFLGLWP
ncbi:hypothetical protein ATY29_24005 [Rhizobium hidalgonense]|nr:hypothetical protein ATY29_24005 [Rhizobium hidalgonense]